MGARDFSDQSVRSQQAKFSCDCSRSALMLSFARSLRVEQSPQVSIAKTVDRKFSAIDRLQYPGVFFRPGIKSAIAPPVFAQRLTDALSFLTQGRLFVHYGQGT